MQVITWLVGILGLGGGGILFYKSKKRQEDAKTKEAQVKADLVEANAYVSRIKNLSDEVKDLSQEVCTVRKELTETRSELTETRGELQKTKEELIAANALIKGLKLNKQEMEEMLSNLKSENEELRRSNNILRRQVGNLKKRNNKAEQE